MPLPLTDPRWSELHSSYNGTGDIVAWLTEAYEQGGLSYERLGDLINEVQHQGDTSTAMYAVATHLIELARRASPKDALTLLTHAGVIDANSEGPAPVSCPAFLRDDFVAAASEGAKMLSPLLPLATDFDAYKWAVAGLAGFIGHHRFARFLDGLDLYEGQFQHSCYILQKKRGRLSENLRPAVSYFQRLLEIELCPPPAMTYPPEPDPFATRETLLLRLRPGATQREVAWREFYDIYGSIIGGFARNMGCQAQDIPDIIQEVLVGFFGASPTFVYNPERGRFRGYLKTCTWRIFQKKLRGRLRVSGRSVEDISDDEQPVEEAWNDCWEQEQLRRAMDEVRQRYMADPDTARTFKAFEMYAILEQPAESIAEQLEMGVNSVHQAKSRVSRAIKAVFDRLNESTG